MTEQLDIFQRKTFPVTLTQVSPLTPPSPGSSVLSTLPAYLTYLQSAGYSRYTPGDFCGDIKKFGLFLKQKTLQEITTNDVRAWVSVLSTKERMTEKSISRKLSALNNYFLWLVSENVLERNPAGPLPNGKVISPLPVILFEDECARLLKGASDIDCRSYLLVLLLLETGIKTEELIELKLTDIDTSNKYAPIAWIKHTGKKIKKDRKLKLPREILPVLEEYRETYHITDTLFPFPQRTLRHYLTTAGQRAKLSKPVSVQLLRDTCAVRLITHGGPIDTVLTKLGLSENTWEDAKEKYLKLTSQAL